MVRPCCLSWLCLQIIISSVPLGNNALHVSFFHLLNSHVTVRFGDCQHTAGHLVTCRQVHVLPLCLGEGSVTEVRSAHEEGPAFQVRVLAQEGQCTYYVFFHNSKASEEQRWDNFLLIALPFTPDSVIHNGLWGRPAPARESQIQTSHEM